MEKTEKKTCIPRVIKYGFMNVDISDKSMRAQCRFCTKTKTVISDKPGVTSNFLKHLERVHSDRYENCLTCVWLE